MTLLGVQHWPMPDTAQQPSPWPPLPRRRPAQLPAADRRDALRCLCGHYKRLHTVRGGACKSCETKHERFAEHPPCERFIPAIGKCKVCRCDRVASDLTVFGVCHSTIASVLCREMCEAMEL